jgi:hypothetical protein
MYILCTMGCALLSLLYYTFTYIKKKKKKKAVTFNIIAGVLNQFKIK